MSYKPVDLTKSGGQLEITARDVDGHSAPVAEGGQHARLLSLRLLGLPRGLLAEGLPQVLEPAPAVERPRGHRGEREGQATEDCQHHHVEPVGRD